jgi:hypothetical protein
MEKDNRKCRRCEQLKPRILVGKYPDGKNKKYADDSGKLWNGSVCGSCNVKRAHENMKRLRQRVKTDA